MMSGPSSASGWVLSGVPEGIWHNSEFDIFKKAVTEMYLPWHCSLMPEKWK